MPFFGFSRTPSTRHKKSKPVKKTSIDVTTERLTSASSKHHHHQSQNGGKEPIRRSSSCTVTRLHVEKCDHSVVGSTPDKLIGCLSLEVPHRSLHHQHSVASSPEQLKSSSFSAAGNTNQHHNHRATSNLKSSPVLTTKSKGDENTIESTSSSKEIASTIVTNNNNDNNNNTTNKLAKTLESCNRVFSETETITQRKTPLLGNTTCHQTTPNTEQDQHQIIPTYSSSDSDTPDLPPPPRITSKLNDTVSQNVVLRRKQNNKRTSPRFRRRTGRKDSIVVAKLNRRSQHFEDNPINVPKNRQSRNFEEDIQKCQQARFSFSLFYFFHQFLVRVSKITQFLC